MKLTIKRYKYSANRVISVIFIIATLFIAYYIYIFPQLLVKSPFPSADADIDQLRSEINNLDVYFVVYIMLGMILTVAGLTGQSKLKKLEAELVKETPLETRKKPDLQNQPVTNNKREQLKSKLNRMSDVSSFWDISLREICKLLNASQGAVYLTVKKGKKLWLVFESGYAFDISENGNSKFEFGEGLIGQVALDKKMVNLKSVPEGYIEVTSGLGKTTPQNMIIVPLILNDKVFGVMEIAAFEPFQAIDEDLVKFGCIQMAERYAALSQTDEKTEKV